MGFGVVCVDRIFCFYFIFVKRMFFEFVFFCFDYRGVRVVTICVVFGEFSSIGFGWRVVSRVEKLLGFLSRK